MSKISDFLAKLKFSIKRKYREWFKDEVIMTPLEEVKEILKDEIKKSDEITREELYAELEVTEEDWQEKFEKETGKNAIWGGKVTKQYQEWRNARKD